MIDQFVDLLRRQREAAGLLEARLRALELIVAAEEQRFLGIALDEVESASEALAGLELARSLVLSTAGLSADATARDVLARFGPASERPGSQELPEAIEELREGAERLSETQRRAMAIVREASADSRRRIDAAQAFAAV